MARKSKLSPRALNPNFEKEYADFQEIGAELQNFTDRLLSQAGSALVDSQHQRDLGKIVRDGLDALILALEPMVSSGVIDTNKLREILTSGQAVQAEADKFDHDHLRYLAEQAERRQAAADAAAMAAKGSRANEKPPANPGAPAGVGTGEQQEFKIDVVAEGTGGADEFIGKGGGRPEGGESRSILPVLENLQRQEDLNGGNFHTAGQ